MLCFQMSLPQKARLSENAYKIMELKHHSQLFALQVTVLRARCAGLHQNVTSGAAGKTGRLAKNRGGELLMFAEMYFATACGRQQKVLLWN